MLAGGCATTTTELVRIEYAVTDNPDQRKIELTYRNVSDAAMCLLPEHWPNSAGKINQASDVVSLVVGRERFPLKSFNTGYCPEGCAIRVESGAVASAFIAYEDFALPDRATKEPKTLDFSPVTFKCGAHAGRPTK